MINNAGNKPLFNTTMNRTIHYAPPPFTCSYDVVLSHGPGCTDGIVAAWCVWVSLPPYYRKLLESAGGIYCYNPTSVTSGLKHINSTEGALDLQRRGFPVVFALIQPGELIPVELIAGKRVLLLDVDMSQELPNIIKYAKHTTLLDHHDSSLNTIKVHKLEGVTNFTWQVDASKQECGATLAWKKLFTTPVPDMIEVVCMGDNWSWDDASRIPSARAILKSLSTMKAFRSFPRINQVFNSWDDKMGAHAKEGAIMLKYEDSIVKRAARQADIGYITTTDGKIYTVAYANASVLHSEIGSNLRWYAEMRHGSPIHFAATWKYAPYKATISVSLRDPLPGIELQTIANSVSGSNQGGGHKDAASFSFIGIENLHKFIQRSYPVVAEAYHNGTVYYNQVL